MNRALRVCIGVAVIVFFSAISNLPLLKENLSSLPGLKEIDSVSRYEKRFDQVKKILPRYGRVGYVGDKYSKDIRFAGDETAKYYLAQYALCPLVLEYGVSPGYTIGNFEKGVVLLKNKER